MMLCLDGCLETRGFVARLTRGRAGNGNANAIVTENGFGFDVRYSSIAKNWRGHGQNPAQFIWRWFLMQMRLRTRNSTGDGFHQIRRAEPCRHLERELGYYPESWDDLLT